MTVRTAVHYDPKTKELFCEGDWTISHAARLKKSLHKIHWPASGTIIINGKNLTHLDTAGAWLIVELQTQLEQKKLQVTFSEFSSQTEKLLSLVTQKLTKVEDLPLTPPKPNPLAVVGMAAVNQLSELQRYFAFVGKQTYELLRLLPHPSHWRWNALSSIIYQAGYKGLSIIALLSFLIGIVLTYQMGLQLKNYGADIYIVDLLGLSVLREFAPLITAIMVAGRTGSAFTASLGMMKLNQEIDALNTLGVTPSELLILPRILGLLIALPLLTMWSDIFGVFGGMVMSNYQLGISWRDFLIRFPQVIPLRSFLIGIGKTPVFALLIASIGCFQGMQVKNSADSVGQNTTKSVVLAIFFIIVADAIFSIIFSKMKL